MNLRNFFFNLGFILTEGFKNIYWRAAAEAAAALLEPDSSSELLYPCFLLQNCPEKKGMSAHMNTHMNRQQ